ncbi:MAG: cell division protein FtsZ [Lentimicrobiaceae bacterium]|nr:cell division protein FtsZ [Lentimicrobiaceae bacterium]
MENMLNFERPDELSPIIKVFGVGGGGGNAANYLFTQGVKGVDVFICDTDAQALYRSPVPNKISLGQTGRGAGMNPVNGREAAILASDKIREKLKENTCMLFITAGMGGGTGTGASPVIAQIAKELGILTIAIVTKPFAVEGRRKDLQAQEGLAELIKHVDSYIVIDNDKILNLDEDVEMRVHYNQADSILATAAKSIAELISIPGEQNLDFEDVKAIMQDGGKALMGSGVATGPDRAREALDEAIRVTLLQYDNISGADNVMVSVTTGKKGITLREQKYITNKIIEITNREENLLWGSIYDDTLDDEMKITVVVVGFDKPPITRVILDGEKTNVSKESSNVVPSNTIKKPKTVVLTSDEEQNRPQEQIAKPKPKIGNLFTERTQSEPIVVNNQNLKTNYSKPRYSDNNQDSINSRSAEKETVKPAINVEPKVNITNNNVPEDNVTLNTVAEIDSAESYGKTEDVSTNDKINNANVFEFVIGDYKSEEEENLNADEEIVDETENSVVEFEIKNVSSSSEVKMFDTQAVENDGHIKAKPDENLKTPKSLDAERRAKLRKFSAQFDKPQVSIQSMEKVPAYIRQGISLSDERYSRDDSSDYEIRKDNNNSNVLRRNNSFLDDNVD